MQAKVYLNMQAVFFADSWGEGENIIPHGRGHFLILACIFRYTLACIFRYTPYRIPWILACIFRYTLYIPDRDAFRSKLRHAFVTVTLFSKRNSDMTKIESNSNVNQ